MMKRNIVPGEVDLCEEKTIYKLELVWRNIILMAILHLSGLYGFYLILTKAMFATIFFMWVYAQLTSYGILMGSHRLWAHRTYKATLPLQWILVFCQAGALQNDIYEWSRDHRVHHKYSETDADPHNAKRGFFFAHVGWLLCRKHPDVIAKGKTIDMSDLEKDPLVRFQRTFYIPLVILCWGLIPTVIPWYFWGESLWNSYFVCVMLRYVIAVNIAWLVNSAAHLWGQKPYDKNINPVESNVRHLMLGEGFHNYHHSFPWDYSASEYGALEVFNPATALIDFFEKIGWAYDLKKASNDVVKGKQAKAGDIGFKKNSSFYELFSGISLIVSPLLVIYLARFGLSLMNPWGIYNQYLL